MSKVKDYLIETQEKQEAEHWALLEAEWQWLNRHSHSHFFQEFCTELAKTKDLLITSSNSVHAETVNKLVYAHAVTLMETFISSAVGKLVVDDQGLLLNLVDEYKVLNGMKVTLKEVLEQPKIVEKRVIETLREQAFHNVSTISQVLNAMFGEHMKGLELGEVARICEKRHHIVHRNGKTVDDQPIELSQQEVQQTIETIRDFAGNLSDRIYIALTERESAEF
ncbi:MULTISPECIES: hypothetical protein [Pseudomonas syringae group]|uniref:hypothetical protein n=1 Tax=Pseudomonas syringae group TaxID=136849 RepID=UPI000208EFCB|nr:MULTISPECIES: hypothetical protein [Pseudomonas syringae group]KPC11829.1 Uncharacterized protein AC500_2968 [Pseudomonas amygdali pv. lachrymans]EGH95508.1 hypothetical protein PLA106_05769 [Pseudomonas amygdali pv. lachrymans str. M302278]PYD02735.1 hypothetical protein DND90_26860 [Pseudomonas syringae pv. maculicola]QQN29891.1 hypothetical protein JHZ65_13420 [Pseudomonas syringae pv. maculicola]RMM15223.1 hypothetical protein ALQ85_01540 [Pseudomonas syringae]